MKNQTIAKDIKINKNDCLFLPQYKTMKTVSIVIIGNYNYNLSKGAYCACISTALYDDFIYGCYKDSSRNRIEMHALIHALDKLQKLYPSEAFNVNVSSKSFYLNLAIASGKITKELKFKRSFSNHDLWEDINFLRPQHLYTIADNKSKAILNIQKQATKIVRHIYKTLEGEEDRRGYTIPKNKVLHLNYTLDFQALNYRLDKNIKINGDLLSKSILDLNCQYKSNSFKLDANLHFIDETKPYSDIIKTSDNLIDASVLKVKNYTNKV